MARLALALVLLGLALGAQADVSNPKPITGRLTCVLPITKLFCARDWRSGFVAGVKYGYDGIDPFVQVCSPGIGNQTTFEMSTPGAIDNANNAAPGWYRAPNPAAYLYPFDSPITQVIVLSAPNPWGEKFGTIPAILFGYLTDNGDLDFAVCGNALYAQFYLNPSRSPPPPTPVTLQAVYTSPLSDAGELTALGSFDGKCSVRGQQFSAYLGGDPWRSSKYFIKKVTRPCFTPIRSIQTWETTTTPPKRVQGDFSCTDEDGNDNDVCVQPCHYDKKHAKKSTSFSCAMHGTAIATGKYGAIVFDRDGHKFDWEKDAEGNLQQVQFTGTLDNVVEGDVSGPEDDMEEDKQ